MTRLPSLKAREVVNGLQTLGFEKVRQRVVTPYSTIKIVAGLLFPSIQPKPSALIFSQIFSNSLRLMKMSSCKP